MPDNSQKPFTHGETIVLWAEGSSVGILRYTAGKLQWQKTPEWLSEQGQQELEKAILAGEPKCGLEGHILDIKRV